MNNIEETARINNQLATQLESFSAQIEANMERGRNSWREWEASMKENADKVCGQVNDYVKTNPYQAVCGAVAIGFLLGFLGMRRR
ncbi:MAG: DUF883 family protein [Verrucomicrobiales bacterium]